MNSWKRTFAALWVAQVFAMIGFSFVIPFLTLFIQKDLGIADEKEVTRWAGNATAAMGFTMTFFAPIWGIVADRYGRKPMVLRSMFGGAMVLGLMCFVQNAHQLLVLRMLQGALTGTISASLALVVSVTPPHRSTFAMGMMHAASLVGGCMGPFVGGRVAYAYGYRAPFLVAAGLLALAALIVHFLAEEKFVPPTEVERIPGSSMFKVLTTAGLPAALLALMVVQFAFAAPGPFLALFVQALSGVKEGAERVTGDILTSAGIAAAVFAAIFGRLADRLGYKRLLILCAVTSGLISVLHIYARSVRDLFFLRIAFAAAAAGIIPSTNAIIRDITSRKHLGMAYGLTSSVSCLGIAMGPFTSGMLTAHYDNNYRIPFVLAGVVLGVAALCVYWTVTPQPPPVPAESRAAPEPDNIIE